MKYFIIFFQCISLLLVVTNLTHAGQYQAVRLIFDTDIESDVDDVGAVAVLHALANRNETEILAMMISSSNPWSASCLDALNTYYGRPDIPIGCVKKNGIEKGSKYTEIIAKEYPHDLKSIDKAPGAVKLYRKILSSQPDNSVTIVNVGYLTNLKNLLDSEPDEFSSFGGSALVQKKVRVLVCMGGVYPKGREWNFYQDAVASKAVVSSWPTPIIYCGHEIGVAIKTGSGLRDMPRNNPVRRSYELYNNLSDRESWDQTAVLYAVRGLNGQLKDVWDVVTTGSNHVNPDGSNIWQELPDNQHAFLARKMKPDRVARIIEDLMIKPSHSNSK